MDLASISSIGAALKGVQEALGVALESRDLLKDAPLIRQLSAAQKDVFALTAQLFELQGKYLEAAEELRKLKESTVEKSRYTLFEISAGEFVYRSDIAPQQGGTGDPGTAQPLHYLCQPCFDKGSKSVLQLRAAGLYCTLCKVCYGPSNGPSFVFTDESRWRDF